MNVNQKLLLPVIGLHSSTSEDDIERIVEKSQKKG